MPGRIVAYRWSELPPDVAAFWDDAVACNRRLTPFHARAWLHRWAEAYGRVASSGVWVQRGRGAEPEALLPVMWSRDELRSLSDFGSDYTGCVTAADGVDLPQLASALVEESRRRSIVLWNVSPEDPLVRALDAAGSLRLLRDRLMRRAAVAEARYRDDAGPPRAAQIARRRARLLRMGAAFEVDVAPSPADVELMIRVHTARWNALGQRGIFADPRCATLFRSLSASGLPFAMSRVVLGGKLIAYRCGFRDARAYYDWNLGFDPAYAGLSPGAVLLAHQFDTYAAAGAPAVFDFLLGEEAYKRNWATSEASVAEYAVRPPR